MNNNISILSTVQLEQPLLNKARLAGVELDVIPFIQIVDITDDSLLQQELAHLYKQEVTVVFTSTNAVYAVCENRVFAAPGWTVYCIENATQKAVLEYFSPAQIVGTGSDARSLADKIVNDRNTRDVVFFCGDKRMSTIPDILAEAGIKVKEHIVYGTVETPAFVAKDYNGILFFSPTAVDSLFSMNMLEPSVVLFAIGRTTAEAIRKETDNELVISDIPSKERVLETAIHYFRNKQI